jgi:translation initiation factor IF-3
MGSKFNKKDPDFHRTNFQIKAQRVRLIDQEGVMVGEVSLKDALSRAEEAGLDLVEMNKKDGQVTAKILDYSKYRYQKQKARKDSKKKSLKNDLKEIKFRPKTAEHDYNFKLKNIKKFLIKGSKVKITVNMRGRENEHPELAFQLIDRVNTDIEGVAQLEKKPIRSPRAISAVFRPSSGKKSNK